MYYSLYTFEYVLKEKPKKNILAVLHTKPTILLLVLVFGVGVNLCDYWKKKYIPNFDIDLIIYFNYFIGNMLHWTAIAPSNT